MGTVYQASHALLRRPTAVKLLDAGSASAAQQQRFETEVQHTARLNHPNIVTIFDYGHTPDGVFYYAMGLIHGVTLERLVDGDGPQPPGRVLAILEQVGQALVCAHGERLVHRDIKPANILLFLPHPHGGQAEQLKLLDFGLVKELKDTGGIDVTHADAIAGTPQYMCPEAITDPAKMDGRGDLYAVGAIGFYLLTGRHVFEGRTVIEVLGQYHAAEPLEPPHTRRFPRLLTTSSSVVSPSTHAPYGSDLPAGARSRTRRGALDARARAGVVARQGEGAHGHAGPGANRRTVYPDRSVDGAAGADGRPRATCRGAPESQSWDPVARPDVVERSRDREQIEAVGDPAGTPHRARPRAGSSTDRSTALGRGDRCEAQPDVELDQAEHQEHEAVLAEESGLESGLLDLRPPGRPVARQHVAHVVEHALAAIPLYSPGNAKPCSR